MYFGTCFKTTGSMDVDKHPIEEEEEKKRKLFQNTNTAGSIS